MNAELNLIADKISEFSGKTLAKISPENLAQIRALISQYVEVLVNKIGGEEAKDILDEPQRNILHIAAKFGDAVQVKKIMNFANVDLSKGDFGKAAEGRDAKYYANLYDENFFTPVHYAAQNGWSEVLKILLENGANASPKSAPKDREWTPIHYAAKSGHLEIVKILISNRVDKEIKTSFGLTPLLVGAEFGHAEIVKFLLEERAEKNVKTIPDNHCMNALHYAAVGGFADVVQILLDAGINKELQTTSGATALHFAVSSGNAKVVEILLMSGVDKEVKTALGHDILYLAASKSKKEVLLLLLKWGIGDLEEALHIAKDHSNQEIVAEIERYQKAIKNLFTLKNLPMDLGGMIKNFTRENLSEGKIILENSVVFNAYGILSVKQKVGMIKKEILSLAQVAKKNGDENLANDLELLRKTAGLDK